jgi:hypothetical protein
MVTFIKNDFFVVVRLGVVIAFVKQFCKFPLYWKTLDWVWVFWFVTLVSTESNSKCNILIQSVWMLALGKLE